MSRWTPGDDLRRNGFSSDDFRRRAGSVRSIPLETVLSCWGAQPDRSDPRRWRTRRGPLTITDSKFFNWHLNQGGGGAIDLVMHLGNMGFTAAVVWLEQQLGPLQPDSLQPAPNSFIANSSVSVKANGCSQRPSLCVRPAVQVRKQLCLPRANLAKLPQVLGYLTQERCLSSAILWPLLESDRVYADCCGNAVFRMLAGKPHRSVGAELRGTGKRTWRGLASGSCRDAGYFWIGRGSSRKIILCESAIDALSCFELHTGQHGTEYICISTAGVRSDARWLYPLIAGCYEIYCGFDDDQAGNTMARKMIAHHPSIKRIRPPAHDWNDALRSR